jgi:hypothetical protein
MSTDISSGFLSERVATGSESCSQLSSHAITIKDEWFGGDTRFSQSQATQVGPFVTHIIVPQGNQFSFFAVEPMLNGESCSTAITLSG